MRALSGKLPELVTSPDSFPLGGRTGNPLGERQIASVGTIGTSTLCSRVALHLLVALIAAIVDSGQLRSMGSLDEEMASRIFQEHS